MCAWSFQGMQARFHTSIAAVFFFVGQGENASFGPRSKTNPSVDCFQCSVKQIGGWFNPKKVISVAVWIYPGPGDGPPLFASVTPLVQLQWRFLASNVAKEIHFVIAFLFQKGQNSCYIHILLDGLWKLFIHYWLTFGLCAFVQMFMKDGLAW